jgi:hypothetical protein
MNFNKRKRIFRVNRITVMLKNHPFAVGFTRFSEHYK